MEINWKVVMKLHIFSGPGRLFQVKECGVQLVYDKLEQESQSNSEKRMVNFYPITKGMPTFIRGRACSKYARFFTHKISSSQGLGSLRVVLL